MLSAKWASEIGLGLDLVAFALLSWDLLRSMHGERMARDEIAALQLATFNTRNGFGAPDAETSLQEDEEFAQGQRRRVEESENDMWRRAVWAKLAIALAAVGGALQIYGGWPTA